MGWIKRNLFFVIGGAVALVLLGGSGFYIYQGWARNSDAAAKLNESYDTLKKLAEANPSPGNDKVNNTEIAKSQQKQIENWVATSGKYFQPIPQVLSSSATSEHFANALHETIYRLQQEAETASVTLAPKYDFSFAAQQPLMQFNAVEQLATQLSEVKAIAEIIFSARVNGLDGIQRVRVSDDDLNGAAADYTDEHSVTNDLAIVTPYIVSFRSFTPEIARVISAFATSSNAFIIKAINVQPAGAATDVATMQANQPPAGYGPGAYMNPGYPRPPGYPAQGAAPSPNAANKGGLQTVLKEQLLKVTLEVELVKLLPKS